MNNSESVNDDEMMSTDNSNGSPERSNIDQYVKGMKNKGLDISETAMTDKQVKEVLDLIVIPKLGSNEHKKYFYVIQSESLVAIKEEYMNPQDHSPDMAIYGKDDWIPQFAKALKKLKEAQWHNSIDELP